MNEYTAIANYYDLLMTSGYYQYDRLAESFSSVISVEHKIIEIGVGSGLLLEALLKIDPQYNLTGMDHTPEMLELAEKRLNSSVKLFQADITSLSIIEKFDIAISNGGLCAFVEEGETCDYYTHLIDYESNLKALQNIADCLHEDGLFIINIQGVHDNYDKILDDEVIYSQEVFDSKTNENCIEKNFYFKKSDRVLAHQKLIYRIFKGQEIDNIFSQAGFELKGKDETGRLFLYSKN